MAALLYEPAAAEDDDRRVAESVIPELEQMDDHLGLSKAWWLLSESHVIEDAGARGRMRSSARSSTRGSSPDRGQLGVLVVLYAQALYYGQTRYRKGAPMQRAPRGGARLADVRGWDRHDARGASRDGGTLRRGTPALRRLDRGLPGVRSPLPARARAIFGAQIETFAGDLSAAEQELRIGYSMLEQMGESGVRSVLAGLLADVLSAEGQDLEAERFVDITRDTASETDVMPQVLWRRSLRGRPPGGATGPLPRSWLGALSRWPGGRTPLTFGPARSFRSERCCKTPGRTQSRRRS